MPYEEQQHLLLRDYLALDRTALANERTLLAYIRTALALLVVGGSLLQFFESFTLDFIGVAFIALAVVTTAIGMIRFRRVYLQIGKVRQSSISATGDEESASADRRPDSSPS